MLTGSVRYTCRCYPFHCAPNIFFPLTLTIAELGSVFYSVKEKNFDGRSTRRQVDREFSKKAELELEMAQQREEYVCLFNSLFILHANKSFFGLFHLSNRTAREETEAKEAVKNKASASAAALSAKMSVPGTPRTVGIGAGARIVQTPKRRGGI